MQSKETHASLVTWKPDNEPYVSTTSSRPRNNTCQIGCDLPAAVQHD